MEGAARARAEETAGSVLARLAAEKPASVELVLVVNGHGRLEGVVPIGKLFGSKAETPLGQITSPAFPSVSANTDQERAASLALHHGVDALPVVDAQGRALGVMPSQALLQVLRRERRACGLPELNAKRRRHATRSRTVRRAPSAALASGRARGQRARHRRHGGLQATLSSVIAVAFFVPGIVYLADAIGTQTEAIAVRRLSLTHAGLARLLTGELRTGMLLGAILGLVSFFPVWLLFGEPRLAAAVATAIFAAGTIAAGLGLLLPWWIARTGRDPAFGSGPLATVIQDVLSLLVYLAVVRAFGI